MYDGFAISEQGDGHKARDLQCQDASGYKIGEDYAIVAVSDGHGGEKYFRSDIGATKAVEVALRSLDDFLKNHKDKIIHAKERRDRDGRIKKIIESVIAEWRKEVEQHFSQHPLNAQEKNICADHVVSCDNFCASFYGATLLYTCMTREFSFASQIGDGKCTFLYEDDSLESPIPDDSRLGFGVTTSLCDQDALGNFRHYHTSYFEKHRVKAIFLATDGVTDSYTQEGLYKFVQKIDVEMRIDKKNTEIQLRDWLPNLSRRGSRDDVTVAGILKITDNDFDLLDNFFCNSM